MTVLNRMTIPPLSNSRDMRAYMQAILEVSGLMAGDRFDITCFMRNYRTHLEAGRLQKHLDGRYSLSEAGRQYFASRLTDDPHVKGQVVCRQEVIVMQRLITSEQPPEGWQQFKIA